MKRLSGGTTGLGISTTGGAGLSTDFAVSSALAGSTTGGSDGSTTGRLDGIVDVPPVPVPDMDKELGGELLTVRGAAPTALSVPAGMTERMLSGGTILRTTRGVISKIISVLLC